MLKFFYSTATLSTPASIALEEAGIKFTPVEVSFKNNIHVDELEKANPLGRVPTIVNENGKALSQNLAVLEYIADLNPSSKLLAAPGSWERSKTISWLAFSISDFHKCFTPLFQAEAMTTSKEAQAEIVQFGTENITEILRYLDQSLKGKDYIVGNHFTIADCHLFVMFGWCTWAELDLTEYRNITSYMKGIYHRPSVQKVLKAEDLLDFVQ
jgi:glutathione S-transferase